MTTSESGNAPHKAPEGDPFAWTDEAEIVALVDSQPPF